MWGGRGSITSGYDMTAWLEPGKLLEGSKQHHYAVNWKLADADSFRPSRPDIDTLSRLAPGA